MRISNRHLALVMMLAVLTSGCSRNENRRLAEMAQQHLNDQVEQNRRSDELQKQIAEGSRRLIEADAKARKEMIALQRDLQEERTEIGQQRDLLEVERRELAGRRHREPIIATAISRIGLLIVAVLPLLVCWFLLRRPVEPADDHAVAEILLEDLVTDRPLLLPTPKQPPPYLEKEP